MKDLNYTLEDEESRQKFIHNEESSLYGGVNVDGERVSVGLEKGVGMTITTYQKNGWIKVSSYDSLGLLDLDTFDGRWNKE